MYQKWDIVPKMVHNFLPQNVTIKCHFSTPFFTSFSTSFSTSSAPQFRRLSLVILNKKFSHNYSPKTQNLDLSNHDYTCVLSSNPTADIVRFIHRRRRDYHYNDTIVTQFTTRRVTIWHQSSLNNVPKWHII